MRCAFAGDFLAAVTLGAFLPSIGINISFCPPEAFRGLLAFFLGALVSAAAPLAQCVHQVDHVVAARTRLGRHGFAVALAVDEVNQRRFIMVLELLRAGRCPNAARTRRSRSFGWTPGRRQPIRRQALIGAAVALWMRFASPWAGRHGHPDKSPRQPMGSSFAGNLRSTVGAWVKEGGNGKAGRKAEGYAERQAEGRWAI